MPLRAASLFSRCTSRAQPQLSFVTSSYSLTANIHKPFGQVQEQGIFRKRLYHSRMGVFERLIRFEGEDGQVQWGDFGGEELGRDVQGKTAHILDGNVEDGFKKTDRQGKIKKVFNALYTRQLCSAIPLGSMHEQDRCGFPPSTNHKRSSKAYKTRESNTKQRTHQD